MPRKFRFHLSSALVVSIVAALFIGINSVARKQLVLMRFAHNFNEVRIVQSYGWPLEALQVVMHSGALDGDIHALRKKLDETPESAVISDVERAQQFQFASDASWKVGLIGNVLVAILCLALLLVFLEHRARKRA